jgi:hypothetical protein
MRKPREMFLGSFSQNVSQKEEWLIKKIGTADIFMAFSIKMPKLEKMGKFI